MEEETYTTTARKLKTGDNIRLSEDHFSKVLSINIEEEKLIVGGPYNKTACALRINTLDGTEILVHPGQLIGVKRDLAPKKKLTQLLKLTMAPHAGGSGV